MSCHLNLIISCRLQIHFICVHFIRFHSVQIVERFQELLKELEEEKQIPPIGVEMMETNVARIYAASKKADNDYRDYPTFLRIAISVARWVQNLDFVILERR